MFQNYRKCPAKCCQYCMTQFSPLPQQGNRQKTCGKKECKKAHKKKLNMLTKAKADRKKSNRLWRKHNKDKIKKYNSDYYARKFKSSKSIPRVESCLGQISRVESLHRNLTKSKEKALRMLNLKNSRVESIDILDHISNTVSIKISNVFD